MRATTKEVSLSVFFCFWAAFASPADATAPTEPCVPAWNAFAGSSELSSTISASARAADGFIYLGGRDGLYRIEGGAVRHWAPNFADPGALPAGRVQALVNDGRYLWVGTAAGLVRFDPSTERLDRVDILKGGGRQPSITALHMSATQGLIVGAMQGLWVRDNRELSDENAFVQIGGSDLGEINSIAATGDVLLVASERGLFRLDAPSQLTELATDLIDGPILDMQPGPNRAMWLITATTLLRFSGNDNDPWLRYDRQSLPGLPPSDFQALGMDASSSLWIGSARDLARWTPDTPHPVLCRRSIDGGDPDRDLSIAHLSGDLGPYMFIGTSGRGAAYAPIDTGIRRIAPGERANTGLPENSIWSTALTTSGQLFLGASSGLYVERTPNAGAFDPIGPDVLGALRIYAVTETQGGEIWIGTNSGAFVYSGEELRPVQLITDVDGAPVSPTVFTIRQYRDKILLGTESGLLALDKETRKLVSFFRTDPAHFGPAHFGVASGAIVDIPANRIWSLDVRDDIVFAAGDDAAFALDLERPRVLASTIAATEAGAFIVGRIFSIVQTSQNKILLGADAGLIETTPDFARFRTIPEINGLSLNSVMSTGRSDDGATWIGVAGNGLFRQSPETGQWTHFTQAAGLITNGVSQLGLSFSADGAVIVSNATGVSIIRDSQRATPWERRLQPTLHAFDRSSGRLIDPSQKLVIGPQKRDLRLHFMVDELLEPDRYRVDYRFGDEARPYTTDTLPIGEDISFASLSPGGYVFEATLASSAGSNGPRLRFEVDVLPYWWEREITHLLIFFLGLGAAFGLFVSRTRAIKRRYELIADERKRIAQDLHDTSLQDILGARMISRSLINDQINDGARQKADKVLELLETATTSVRTSVQEVSGLNTYSSLSDAVRACEPPAKFGQNIAISLFEDGKKWNMGDQRRFFISRIIQEAVNNACKHARPTQIQITLRWSWRRLVAVVEDDGDGFAPEELSDQAGFGIGAMKRMAKAAKAEFRIESTKGRGACVHLKASRYFI